MNQQLEDLKKWIGEKESVVDHVAQQTIHRLSATLDRDDPLPEAGDPIPFGWHMIFFPHVVRHSGIGADGHPRSGDFLPPVPLPRRMFAGRRLVCHDYLRVGDDIRRDSTIQQVNIKQGRSGDMVFVTLKTDISTPRGVAISEEHDIVYRGEPDPNAPMPPSHPIPGTAVWSRTITPDSVMLFRYVALGFVSHRIHYDHPYVTKTEGYPDLVVPGGIHTINMFELGRANSPPSAKYRKAAWRALRPLFVNRPFTVCGEPDADGRNVKLWVVNDRNELALSATAEIA